MKGGHAEARRDILCDPPPGLRKALLHVFGCGSCRGLIEVALRRSELDEPDLPDYSGLLLEEARKQFLDNLQGRLEAQGLLKELLAGEAREQLLEDPGYATGEFLEAVLASAKEAPPEAAVELAHVAFRLIEGQSGLVDDEEGVAGWRAQAALILGDAQRQLGLFSEARTSFDKASANLALAPWRFGAGELCRYEGILSWELGDLDRAEALLRQSARILGELGPPTEEAAARVRLGLLLSERGEGASAMRLLQAGQAVLDADTSPWLALQARLGLAWEATRVGLEDRARLFLVKSSAQEKVVLDDPRAQWLEGRVWARVGGEAERGERLLETARVRLLRAGDVAHATLCSVDLAGVLITQGRGVEVEGLVSDLAACFPDEPAPRESLGWVWRATSEGILGPAVSDAALGDLLRRTRQSLRAGGHRVLLPV